MRIGTQELLIVLLIVVVVFGPTQIPKLTKMFGKSVKNFREGMNSSDDDDTKKDDVKDEKKD
ncbi:MAG TPA: twin-arginine translocase TatA/TatE family subunit [Oribacterium sp.]|jgi:sec-independent protein translocase protein TatA|nr:twin-arginine translocase TatA/TatE family subunit [Oribacterium sp.]